MNDVKPTKWNQFLRSKLLHYVCTLCIAVIAPFIVTAIRKNGGENLMRSLFQTYFIELWPIWFGIGLALIYWVTWKTILINNFLNKGLRFDEKLDMLGAERRELMTHVHNSYNGLSNTINKSLNVLSNRLDKIEKGASDDL